MEPSRSGDLQTTRVLVVEDEVLIREFIEDVLTGSSYQVVGVAAEGAEAVRLVASMKPEIAVIDITLRGDINGLEAARLMRADDADLRIIFISGSNDPEIYNNVNILKPAWFLPKPFLPKHLLASLDSSRGAE